MPNVLLTVTADKGTIRSGDIVNLTIAYESVRPGDVEFVCSAPFKLSTKKWPLAPSSNGHTIVPMKIERTDPHGPVTCDILCTFLDSPTAYADVDVTS